MTSFIKSSKNIKMTFLIILGIFLWIASGVFWNDKNFTPEDKQDKIISVSVTAEHMYPQSYTKTINLIGSSEPLTQISFAAQTAGTIKNLKSKRGDMVAKGQLLLNIDMANRKTELTAAKANLLAVKTQTTATKHLFKEGFSSETKLAAQEASLAAAEESLARIEQDISYTHVISPIDGIIEDRMVDIGDYVTIGTPLFEIISRDQFLLVGYAAQQERKLIKPKQVAHATLANSQKVAGIVRFIATNAQESTKTYRVEVLVDGNEFQIPTGMTASLSLPVGKTNAYLIPHSLLVLADDGTVGVMTVKQEGDKNLAHFIPISPLDDTSIGLWVEGLPTEGVSIITRGQAAITDGILLNVKETNKEM